MIKLLEKYAVALLSALLIGTVLAPTASAQSPHKQLFSLGLPSSYFSVEARAVDNVSLGKHNVFKLASDYTAPKTYSMQVGLMWSSFGRFASDIRTSLWRDVNWGRLHFETLLHNNSQGTYNTLCAGMGAGTRSRYWWLTLGYYYRAYLSHPGIMDEPINFYYELGINLLPNIIDWDAQIIFTNSSLCELERQYSPTWLAKGHWYPNAQWSISLGAGYKAAGMFNMSTDYWQSYVSLEMGYRW